MEEPIEKNIHVVVILESGETLLAISPNIMNWDEGKIVNLINPLSVMPTLHPDRFSLSFCKKLLFTDDYICILKADSIQSYSYMDNQSIEFYKSAISYFETTVDVVIDKELEKYTKLLKEKREGTNKESLERIKLFLQHVYGGNTLPTMH